MQVDSEKTIAEDVRIDDINMVVKDVGKRPMVLGKSVNSSN